MFGRHPGLRVVGVVEDDRGQDGQGQVAGATARRRVLVDLVPKRNRYTGPRRGTGAEVSGALCVVVIPGNPPVTRSTQLLPGRTRPPSPPLRVRPPAVGRRRLTAWPVG